MDVYVFRFLKKGKKNKTSLYLLYTVRSNEHYYIDLFFSKDKKKINNKKALFLEKKPYKRQRLRILLYIFLETYLDKKNYNKSKMTITCTYKCRQ